MSTKYSVWPFNKYFKTYLLNSPIGLTVGLVLVLVVSSYAGVATPLNNSEYPQELDAPTDFNDEELLIDVTQLHTFKLDLMVYHRQSQILIDFCTQNPDLKFSADVKKSFEQMQDRIQSLTNLVDNMLEGATLEESTEEVTSNVRPFRDINPQNFRFVARDMLDSFGSVISSVRDHILGQGL